MPTYSYSQDLVVYQDALAGDRFHDRMAVNQFYGARRCCPGASVSIVGTGSLASVRIDIHPVWLTDETILAGHGHWDDQNDATFKRNPNLLSSQRAAAERLLVKGQTVTLSVSGDHIGTYSLYASLSRYIERQQCNWSQHQIYAPGPPASWGWAAPPP